MDFPLMQTPEEQRPSFPQSCSVADLQSTGRMSSSRRHENPFRGFRDQGLPSEGRTSSPLQGSLTPPGWFISKPRWRYLQSISRSPLLTTPSPTLGRATSLSHLTHCSGLLWPPAPRTPQLLCVLPAQQPPESMALLNTELKLAPTSPRLF